MKKIWFFLWMGTLVLAACGGETVAPAAVEPTAAPVVATEPPSSEAGGTAVMEAEMATATSAPATAPAMATATTAMAEPTETAVPVPTATVMVEATEMPASDQTNTDPRQIFGRTDEGYFYRGSPDAPVTILDYSDFL